MNHLYILPARIACVFILALEKIFGANCKGYLRTFPWQR